MRPFVGTQPVGDALTPTREAEKETFWWGFLFFCFLVGLGIGVERDNWEQLWEQNSNTGGFGNINGIANK